MHYTLEQFIDEAIQLELHVAEIYTIFSEAIPEDGDFWALLSWEERNHASLLQTGKDVLLPAGQFPREILPAYIQALIDNNRWLQSLREKYVATPPDRRTAFTVALKMENSAGEQHFQRVMESPSDSKAVKIFQELCQDDINHANRIREYMRKVGEPAEPAGTGEKKILVVMDEDSVAELLQTILATEGEVDIARNGREGLQKVREKQYDLIVSTVEMKELDGITFFRAAKKNSPGLHERFLFFTGNPTPDRVSFFDDENLRYLVKPATISEIRTAALSILR